MKKLLAFLLVAIVAMALVACGEATTTTPPATTTSKPEVTTTDPTVTTTAPITSNDTTTTTAPVTTTDPSENTTEAPVVLSAPDQYIADWDNAQDAAAEADPNYVPQYVSHVQTHMKLTINHKAKGNDGVTYPYMFYFTFKAEGNHFKNDPETNVPGVQFTTPDCIFIAECEEDGTAIGEYKKYNIAYWAPAEWYIINCVAEGFVPEDGKYYDIYLFFKSDDNPDHSTYPDCLHYMWDYEAPFLYEAPAAIESGYGSIEEMVPNIDVRTQLYYHDEFSITDGAWRFTFKSDNRPFTDGSGDEGSIYGVSFTILGDVFINGEKVTDKCSNYSTQDWYVLMMDIDYNFVSGESYEFVIAVNSNDDSGTYCNDADGYFILYTYVAP